MPWPTGCRCRPVIHNFLCLCVCMCVPPPLACQQDMALSEIRDLPSLSPPLGLCPLSASAASAQFEKQSSKSIITACAIRCWRLFSPPPSWNVAQSHPHFGFRFVFATLRYVCFPSPPLRHLLPAQLRNFFGIVWVLPTSDNGVGGGGGFNCANCQRDKAASHAAVMKLKGSLSLRGV